MPTSLPTPIDSADRIEAGHRAVDALNNMIGELRGLLEHDPDARGELLASLGVMLGQDQLATDDPIIVRQDRRRSLQVELLGDDIAVVDRWSDDGGDTRPVWLTPGAAEDLAVALLAAAQTARQAADR